jgi:hypothetical protein
MPREPTSFGRLRRRPVGSSFSCRAGLIGGPRLIPTRLEGLPAHGQLDLEGESQA